MLLAFVIGLVIGAALLAPVAYPNAQGSAVIRTDVVTSISVTTSTYTSTTMILASVIVSGNVVTSAGTIPFEIQFQANNFTVKGHLENGNYDVVLPNHVTYTIIVNYGPQSSIGQCTPKLSPWTLDTAQTYISQDFSC